MYSDWGDEIKLELRNEMTPRCLYINRKFNAVLEKDVCFSTFSSQFHNSLQTQLPFTICVSKWVTLLNHNIPSRFPTTIRFHLSMID